MSYAASFCDDLHLIVARHITQTGRSLYTAAGLLLFALSNFVFFI